MCARGSLGFTMLWSLQEKELFGLFSLQTFCLREAVIYPQIHGYNSKALCVCSAATAPGVSAQIQSFPLRQGLSRPPRTHHNLPQAPVHDSRKHLAVTFPEPARHRQDPGSRQCAWGREAAPQYWQQVPSGRPTPSWRRGVRAQCSRWRRTKAQAARRWRRRGIRGGGGGGGTARGRSVAQGQAEAAADTHSARTPGSLLPSPPYCSRPGLPRGLKPRDNLPEPRWGGACMGA